MLVSIHQPNYLPWLGYFDKIKRADLFIFLDKAQYSKNDFHNRNKIKTPQGPAFLTIPIEKSEHFQPLNQVKLPKDNSWQKKHFKAIQLAYARAPYFKEHQPFFELAYQKQHQLLVDLNIEIIVYLVKAFGFKTKLARESAIGIASDLKATERLVALIKQAGGSSYYSGKSGQDYLDLKQFEKQGIEVKFQDYHERQYRQMFGDFMPGLSAIDLLFNEGPRAGEII